MGRKERKNCVQEPWGRKECDVFVGLEECPTFSVTEFKRGGGEWHGVRPVRRADNLCSGLPSPP